MHQFYRLNNKGDADVPSLVLEAKRGQKEAFGALYEHFASPIYRFIFLKTSNREDAEDLLHQTFLKAWDHIQSYEDRGASFQSWLYSIARNTVTDFYRTRKATISLASYASDPIEAQKDPTNHLELNLALKNIRMHIDRLSHTEQDALILRYVEDLEHKTIAGILQKSESATKVLIHRALAKIKLRIDQT